MRNMVKRTAAGAVLGGSLLVTGGLGIASAAPAGDVNDQLVNLAVGNGSTIRDLNVETASQIAGLLCGTGTGVNGTTSTTGPNASAPAATGMSETQTTANPGEISAQARQVDAGTIPTTTCESPQGIVTISQNGPANSPNAAQAPGQQRGPNGTMPSDNSAENPAPAGQLNPAPTSG